MKPMTPDRLLAGLDAIAVSLSGRPQALALLALGSCGLERARLDAYSDLDFFVIVEGSAKQSFIENLDWLTTGAPLVFAHRNTVDGWKTLNSDGVLCEFAVFHAGELAHIPFAEGRVVWARDGFDVARLTPSSQHYHDDPEWLAVEAMTNILVGLKRYLRGEKLAASRAISVDAVDQVARVLQANKGEDLFNPWRRIEATNSNTARELQTALDAGDPPRVARKLTELISAKVTVPTPLLDEVQSHLDACDAR
jgi:hypothetical protein